MTRDQLVCPRCAAGLDATALRLACVACNGELMPEKQFLERITGEQAQALLKPRHFWQIDASHPGRTAIKYLRDLGPVIDSSEPALVCPCCATAMTKHRVYNVAVDRCAEHGVWLDGTHELAAILKAATKT